ncbi:MAG: hypothetical protein JSV88_12785 [Candidatus Aminicenantes bacterium]|nr:MAG: hypothetical protein JSV88_12785 [Candidatus Aminicenantes bacterium]
MKKKRKKKKKKGQAKKYKKNIKIIDTEELLRVSCHKRRSIDINTCLSVTIFIIVKVGARSPRPETMKIIYAKKLRENPLWLKFKKNTSIS